mgnify:CR=1 FL=1|jgi:outer membrane protein assembly factor BamD
MLFKIPVFALLIALGFVPSLAAQEEPGSGQTSMSTGGEPPEAFVVAENIEDSGNSGLAVSAYKSFIKNFPTSPFASTAQFRIANILSSQGNPSKAFDAYQTLLTTYPDTPNFDAAVAQQVLIANAYLQGKRMVFMGMPIVPGTERAQKMYESILNSAPYSKHAPIAQFNLGLSLERQKMIAEARQAYQKVLDRYPNSDVCDDALYQIGYIYMRQGLSGGSQDLSALVLAKETFQDFLLQYPASEKSPQASDNLAAIGAHEAGDLMRIASFYDRTKDFKAAIIYYNDIVRKQPDTADAKIAGSRIEELRAQVGDEALRVGSESAESGEKLALRRRLQAQVESSALANFSGPPTRDIVPDELPVVKKPRFRTNIRDLQPLPAPVEPLLPTE